MQLIQDLNNVWMTSVNGDHIWDNANSLWMTYVNGITSGITEMTCWWCAEDICGCWCHHQSLGMTCRQHLHACGNNVGWPLSIGTTSETMDMECWCHMWSLMSSPVSRDHGDDVQMAWDHRNNVQMAQGPQGWHADDMCVTRYITELKLGDSGKFFDWVLALQTTCGWHAGDIWTMCRWLAYITVLHKAYWLPCYISNFKYFPASLHLAYYFWTHANWKQKSYLLVSHILGVLGVHQCLSCS